jgi:hypothetical protein
MAARMKSFLERRRCSLSSERVRRAPEAKIAMSSRLSKTICFTDECGGLSIGVSRLRFRSQNPSSHLESMMPPAVDSGWCVSHKRTQRAQSSLGSGGPWFHMPHTYRCCACSIDTDTLSTFRRRDNTWWGRLRSLAWLRGKRSCKVAGEESTMEGQLR